MATGFDKDGIWETAKNDYKIQQIREEWEWLIDKVFRGEKPTQNILDIGAYDGGTSFYLNQFANNQITIDLNPCRFDYSKFFGNYKYVAGDSHHPDQTKYFGEYDWDFVFIDGDHSYEGVKADFYNILPYLKKGTPVAFHDIAISDFHHQHGCYVGEFWRDLKKEYNATKFEEFSTHSEWAGIGIVYI